MEKQRMLLSRRDDTEAGVNEQEKLYYSSYQGGSESDVHSEQSVNQSFISPKAFLTVSLCLVTLTSLLVYTSRTNIVENSSTPKTDAVLSEDTHEPPILPKQSNQQNMPNFVFILADDLSWNSMGYMGYDLDFASPTMTAMAEDGVIMTNFYAQEICTPSRAALMTGRYPSTVGMQYYEIDTNTEWGLPLAETTISDVLKDNGYTNYMLGKWNLGYFTADYLPTSRGFDQFLGFVSAQTYYWCKGAQVFYLHGVVNDFMYSDKTCYDYYGFNDQTTYSTTLYAEKAAKVIQGHDFDTSPMFLYFSAQAVHDPFYDRDDSTFDDGIPSSYVGQDMYDYFTESVVGNKRQQYGMALYLLDEAVASLKHELAKVNQLENTYFIFASDNGGCADAGGANAPLRGTKGSLFEGGVKTNSFIWASSNSPADKASIQTSQRGSSYSGLMHMSDWFPTILDLAGIAYTAPSGYELDGVSQVGSWESGVSARDYLVINLYTNVDDEDGVVLNCTNANCAIRDERYKLMHVWDGGKPTQTYAYDTTYDNDDAIMNTSACMNSAAMNDGVYSYLLYDMWNDPYETTNLYYEKEYVTVVADLEGQMAMYESVARPVSTPVSSTTAVQFQKTRDSYLQPWVDVDGENVHGAPQWCDYIDSVPNTFFHDSTASTGTPFVASKAGGSEDKVQRV